MKNVILIVVFLSLFGRSFSQNIADVKSTLVNQKDNTYMTCIVGNELTAHVDRVAVQKEINLLVRDDDQKKLFDNITAENQTKMTQHKIAAGIIDLNGEIIKYSTSTVPVFGKVVSYSMDKLNRYLIDESMNSVKVDLENRLRYYRQKQGKQNYEKLVASYNPENPQLFINNLNTVLNPIEKDYLKNVPEDEKSIVQHFYTTQVANVLKSGFEALSTTVAVQDATLKQAQNNINALGRAFYQGTKKNQEAFTTIIEMQNDIQNDVDQLKKDVDNFKDETNNNFQFVFDFMYSRMSISERQDAIRQGLMDKKLNEEQKVQELKRLAILEKQEKLETTISEMISNGSAVLNIAKNLKLVDPKILGTANTILQAASIGQAAFKAFSSGNYLGAVSAISDIFGLGGPDVGQQRHEQIMKSFDMVFARLDNIDKKLDILIQGQEQIIKNQEKIYRTIIDLSIDVSKNHVEVMDKLREIHGDIIINRQLIMANILSQYSNCSYFSPPTYSSSTNSIVQTSKQIFPSLTTFREWWATNKESCEECKKRFVSVYSGGDKKEYNPIFTTNRIADITKNDAKLKLDTVYNYSLALLYSKVKGLPLLKDNMENYSAFYPLGNFHKWGDKVSILDSLASPIGDFILRQYVLEPNIVELHTRYILNFHVYYMLINPFDGDKPFTYDEYIKQKTISKKGREALIETLDLLDQTIAQQNLLSGDILIPIISQIFDERDTSDVIKERRYQQSVKLLNDNTLLARNFFVYRFEKELEDHQDKKYISYRISQSLANRYGDISGLKKLTTFNWSFSFSKDKIKNEVGATIQPKGISIRLGNKFYPLPVYEDLVSGEIEHTPDFNNLLPLREELFREISSYKLYDRLKQNEVLALNAALLY